MDRRRVLPRVCTGVPGPPTHACAHRLCRSPGKSSRWCGSSSRRQRRRPMRSGCPLRRWARTVRQTAPESPARAARLPDRAGVQPGETTATGAGEDQDPQGLRAAGGPGRGQEENVGPCKAGCAQLGCSSQGLGLWGMPGCGPGVGVVRLCTAAAPPPLLWCGGGGQGGMQAGRMAADVAKPSCAPPPFAASTRSR